jgi:hypothetical protein
MAGATQDREEGHHCSGKARMQVSPLCDDFETVL